MKGYYDAPLSLQLKVLRN